MSIYWPRLRSVFIYEPCVERQRSRHVYKSQAARQTAVPRTGHDRAASLDR